MGDSGRRAFSWPLLPAPGPGASRLQGVTLPAQPGPRAAGSLGHRRRGQPWPRTSASAIRRLLPAALFGLSPDRPFTECGICQNCQNSSRGSPHSSLSRSATAASSLAASVPPVPGLVPGNQPQLGSPGPARAGPAAPPLKRFTDRWEHQAGLGSAPAPPGTHLRTPPGAAPAPAEAAAPARASEQAATLKPRFAAGPFASSGRGAPAGGGRGWLPRGPGAAQRGPAAAGRAAGWRVAVPVPPPRGGGPRQALRHAAAARGRAAERARDLPM